MLRIVCSAALIMLAMGAAACGGGDDPDAAGKKSALGESCAATSDCEGTLRCVVMTCSEVDAADSDTSSPADVAGNDTGGPPSGMVLIPAGTFQMGCTPGDAFCNPDESPRHEVTLDAYYMDVNEVTVAKYATCVSAKACTHPDTGGITHNWGNPGARQEHPVNAVTWHQADAYCKWAGGRLPTEAEWENAARGGLDEKKFPWGDEWPTCTPGRKNTAVFDDLGDYGCSSGITHPVGTGSYANGYGLYDMAGNVWEWVADWFGPYGDSTASNPQGPGSGSYRVLRGGSFYGAHNDLRASDRYYDYTAKYFVALGFRCARSVSP